ncbi:Hypothetical predicted protein [Mytilus galloprovincialis]|nr:Hypothetical predicted protein [Mytilus galloprovincialis]VDI61826.1 Hypothetical predicted protein [Mytilus galloprovincialis]
MENLATCSKFHGYPQDNGHTFLTEFESFSTLHGLSEFNLTDKRMLAAFHLHLKGPALTWYNSLSDESKSDWKSVRILFKEKYVNFCGHGANALMHSEIFQNLSLSSGQSVEDFYCLIYEKGKLLAKPEHEMLSKFISGLPEQMSFFVRAGMPQDMQNALASAKMAEAYGYRKHDESVNAAGLFKNKFHDNRRTAAGQNTEVRDLQQQIQELRELVKTQKEMKSDKSFPEATTAASSEISEMKDQIQTLTSLLSSMNVQNKPQATNNRQNTPYRNYNYPANDRQVNNDRNNFSGPCFKCQGRGHRQRECYWNGMGQSSSTAKCQLCQQEGHTANFCAQFDSGNRQNPGDRHGRPG